MQDENENNIINWDGDQPLRKASLEISEVLRLITVKDGDTEFKTPLTPEGNRDSFYVAAHLTRDSVFILLKKIREVIERDLEDPDTTMEDISNMVKTLDTLTKSLSSLYDMTSKALSDTDPSNVKKPNAKQIKLIKKYLPDYSMLMDDTLTDDDIEKTIQEKILQNRQNRKSIKDVLDDKQK
jgi:hypothetical protein